MYLKGFRPRSGSKSGFTLLEVLVALLIFAIGVAVLINSLGIGIFSISAVERRAQAFYLASHILERLYGAPYANIVSEPRAPFNWPPVPAGQAPVFEREIQVTELQPNLKQVTVTIYYRTKNREISEKLATLIANRG